MFELGDETAKEHAAIIDLLLAQNDTDCIVVGKHFYEAAKNSPHILAFDEINDVKKWLTDNPPKDKFILLKGSRGMKMEQLLGFL